MNKDSVFAFLIGSLVFLIPIWGMIRAFNKLDNLQSTVDIHNDITSGNATYIPGHACTIRAGVDDTPEDIVRYAKACSAAHREHLQKSNNGASETNMPE